MTNRICIREARNDDLPGLLDLYKHLHAVDDPLPHSEALAETWDEMRNSPSVQCIVADDQGKVVSSCVVAIVPNLTRGARPFAVVENVVTHSDYRKQGLGQAVVNKAIAIARSHNCHKVILLSNHERREAHHLYEKLGFKDNHSKGYVLHLRDSLKASAGEQLAQDEVRP